VKSEVSLLLEVVGALSLPLFSLSKTPRVMSASTVNGNRPGGNCLNLHLLSFKKGKYILLKSVSPGCLEERLARLLVLVVAHASISSAAYSLSLLFVWHILPLSQCLVKHFIPD